MPSYRPLPNDRSRSARGFGLRQIWEVVQRNAQLITLTTLTVVLLATIYVLQVRPHYDATSEVMLDPRKWSVENATAVLSSLPADQPTILNQIEILTSHRFAGEVVDRFHLDRDPEFAAPGFASLLFASDADPRETAITKLRNGLKVAQAGFSSSIRITVASADRDKAAEISSAVASMYVAEQLGTKTQASRQASLWLTGRVNELARQVRDAEAAVQKYKADHHITLTAAGTSVLEQQVADLNSQLTVARTEYDDKASKAGRTTELLRSGALASAPQVIASPLIASLRTQQSELNRVIANIATKYGPNHPKMIELVAQRGDLDAKISQETLRIAESVRNEADSSGTHVASLQKSLRQIEDLSAREKQEGVELTALQSAAASARAMYQAFLTQFSQTENQQGILRPDAYVISASEVTEAFGPQTKLLAVLSAIPAGLLLGLALAFMAERGLVPMEPNPAGRPEPLRQPPYQSAPQPAAVLSEMGAGLRAADLVVTSPGSSFAATVAQLLSGILAVSAPPATIVITAMTPGAGKTTLALALARTAAQAGIRTIVVDANRTACHLGAMTGRTAAVLSWPEAFARQGGADDFIASDPLSPALVLADDPNLIGYENVLAPPVLARLIANFKTSLDLVIIASPPIGDVLAPAVLALADTVLVAVDSRRPGLPVRLPGPAVTVFTHAR